MSVGADVARLHTQRGGAAVLCELSGTAPGLGQWEYRVFEKAIVVLVIVGFYGCLSCVFSGAFSVTKTNFGPIIGRFITIVGIPAENYLNALGRTRTYAGEAQ